MSNTAVEVAIHSASTFGTHLTFVNVIDPNQIVKFGSVDESDDILKAKMMGEMALEAAARSANDKGADFETKIVNGDTAKTLIEMSKDQNMIIMSIHGRNGL